MKHPSKILAAVCFAALLSVNDMGMAETAKLPSNNSTESNSTESNSTESNSTEQSQTNDVMAESEQIADSLEQLDEAALVVQQMAADPDLEKLMQQAKGIFIVPDYARAGLGIGGEGGEGVLLTHNKSGWSAPVFYNIGGVSIGPEAGIEVGAIALLLMTDKAIDRLNDKHNFSFNVDAGLTIINYSRRAHARAGQVGDIIVWADTEGAFAGLTLGITDISWDDDETHAYYQTSVVAEDILSGSVKNPHGKHELEKLLPS